MDVNSLISEAKMARTIKEIASLSGVSKSTVSRVISGKGYASPEAREKVLQVIREVQYKPNAVARAMVSKHTGNIGVILYRQQPPIVSHPLYGKILDSILTTAAALSYSVFVTTDQEVSLHSADFMLEKRVDGLILISRFRQNVIDHIKNFHVSYLMVNGTTEDNDVIHIVNKDEQGGQKAAGHLFGLGHRRIFIIAGPQEHRSHNLRLNGFCGHLQEKGYPVPASAVAYASASDFAEGYEVMRRNWGTFANHSHTALFATNDTLALGAMKFLLEKSVRIPEQVAVMGFDDIDLAAMYQPGLTTIQVEKTKMGHDSVIILDRLIKHGQVEAKMVEYEPRLIVRESTRR
jgi:LacI family transcriptional regulator